MLGALNVVVLTDTREKNRIFFRTHNYSVVSIRDVWIFMYKWTKLGQFTDKVEGEIGGFKLQKQSRKNENLK